MSVCSITVSSLVKIVLRNEHTYCLSSRGVESHVLSCISLSLNQLSCQSASVGQLSEVTPVGYGTLSIFNFVT